MLLAAWGRLRYFTPPLLFSRLLIAASLHISLSLLRTIALWAPRHFRKHVPCQPNSSHDFIQYFRDYWHYAAALLSRRQFDFGQAAIDMLSSFLSLSSDWRHGNTLIEYDGFISAISMMRLSDIFTDILAFFYFRGFCHLATISLFSTLILIRIAPLFIFE